MRYITLCSGIEAPTVAWRPLGWKAVAFAEVEPFCNAVLAHHYPETENLGDITKITKRQIKALGPIDLVCGGTPCQGFSVAGARGGLDDPRSQLALRFCDLVGYARPTWVLWENVPGCLSTNGGRDFGAFLGGLAGCGYSLAWRILDAQYFGLAQRRKRVFLVGHLGTDWRYPAAVLFERQSMSGDTSPIRSEEQGPTGTIDCGANRRRGAGVSPAMITHALRSDGFDASEDGTGRGMPLVASPITAGYGKSAFNDGKRGVDPMLIPVTKPCLSGGHANNPIDENLVVEIWRQTCNCGHGFIGPLDMACPKCKMFQGGYTHGDPIVFDSKQSGQGGDVAPPLRALNHDKSHANAGGQLAVAFAQNTRDEFREIGGNLAGTLPAQPGMNQQTYLQGGFCVRRLTLRECERLQGFPDNYTAIEYRKKPASDGPRYKALGNSMAVPVVQWIGKRIVAVPEAARVEVPA